MIGNFKPNLNKRERWNSKTFTSNSCDAFNTYLKHKGCFIDVKTINNTKYYHTFEKVFNTNLETESPIYNQILQQEQIELRDVIELMISRPRSNPLKSLLITVMSRHSTGRGRSRVAKRRIKLFKN
jgi:hypothetical protein